MKALVALVVGLMLCVPFCVVNGIRWYKSVQFDIHCGGHLKRAGDANTVEMATKELEASLQYMEANGLTQGSTGVLWQTPSEDVGFWYNNVKSAREELKKVTEQTTQLERTNLLIKLRETLMDHGQGGDHITIPSGISVFPSNGLYMVLGLLSGIMGIVGVIVVIIAFCMWMDNV